MAARTMTPKFSDLTTEKQKAYLSSMVMQDIVHPMELELLSMQLQLTAMAEGKKWKKPDEKELALIAAQNRMQEMEMQQRRLAALAVAMLYWKYMESEDKDDGQQRIDAFE